MSFYEIFARDSLSKQELCYSLEAIAEAQTVEYDFLPNGGIIDDISRTWRTLDNVILQYGPRSCNMVAHRLASVGFEASYGTTWTEHPSRIILDVLMQDCNNLP